MCLEFFEEAEKLPAQQGSRYGNDQHDSKRCLLKEKLKLQTKYYEDVSPDHPAAQHISPR